jgi:hypothetical protein
MDINKWNNEVLKKQGVKHTSRAPKIVRSIGDAKRAVLTDGTVVNRTDMIFVGGYGLLKCMNTELHFIYEAPQTNKGWGLWCTCGSIAGAVGWSAYTKLASPNAGFVIACVRYLTTKQNDGIGRHADESTE